MNSLQILKMSDASLELKDLFELAKKTRENAYCRYSGYHVGAAVRLSDGSSYGGCNVENASFGGTNCAERVAIQKAVSEKGGAFTLKEVVVVTDSTPPWPPCGLCRQVIAEFAKDTLIYAANLAGEYQRFTFEEIFPMAFNSKFIDQS